MQSIADLIRQKEDLERQIKEATCAKRSEAIGKIKELMGMHGLTVADLGGSVGKQPAAKDAAAKKVAAKYKNQETGDTWTGRGIKPKWLQSALAAGKSIDDFLILEGEKGA